MNHSFPRRPKGALALLKLSCVQFLVANIVTTSKALVTSSDALVPSSFLFLMASCYY